MHGARVTLVSFVVVFTLASNMAYFGPLFRTLGGLGTLMTYGLPTGAPLLAPIGTRPHAMLFLRLLAPYGTLVSLTPYVFVRVEIRLVGLAQCIVIVNTLAVALGKRSSRPIG